MFSQNQANKALQVCLAWVVRDFAWLVKICDSYFRGLEALPSGTSENKDSPMHWFEHFLCPLAAFELYCRELSASQRVNAGLIFAAAKIRTAVIIAKPIKNTPTLAATGFPKTFIDCLGEILSRRDSQLQARTFGMT